MSSNTHKHRYKNVGLDAGEMRRRREEEGTVHVNKKFFPRNLMPNYENFETFKVNHSSWNCVAMKV